MISLRKSRYELVCAGGYAGLTALFLGGIFLSPAQVVQDRPAEESIVLKDYGHLIPEALESVALHINSPYRYPSLAYVVQAAYQRTQRTLSAACTAYYSYGLACFYPQVDIFKGIVSAFLV